MRVSDVLGKGYDKYMRRIEPAQKQREVYINLVLDIVPKVSIYRSKKQFIEPKKVRYFRYFDNNLFDNSINDSDTIKR